MEVGSRIGRIRASQEWKCLTRCSWILRSRIAKNVAFTSGSAGCSYAIHLAASNEFWPRHALLGVSIEGPLAKCGKSEESNLAQHSSSQLFFLIHYGTGGCPVHKSFNVAVGRRKTRGSDEISNSESGRFAECGVGSSLQVRWS